MNNLGICLEEYNESVVYGRIWFNFKGCGLFFDWIADVDAYCGEDLSDLSADDIVIKKTARQSYRILTKEPDIECIEEKIRLVILDYLLFCWRGGCDWQDPGKIVNLPEASLFLSDLPLGV